MKKIKCPYCQTEQLVLISLIQAGHHSRIIRCDEDDAPGCGRQFVLDTHTTVGCSVRAIADPVDEKEGRS